MSKVEVMDRSDRRSDLSVRILLKILISFAIGTMAYVITELTGQPEIWSITLSVFVAGVTLVVQFLMEFESRLARVETAKERHSARIETMVEEGFAKISTATELFSLVESSALRTDAVIQLVRHSTRIDPESPKLAFDLAQAEISRLSNFLKGLGDSEPVTYEGEDRDWLLALTRLAAASIDATSLTTVDARGVGFTDGGFWDTDLGRRYLAAQAAAIRRGVKIRRVFVILHTSASSNEAGLSDVCRQQREHGVDVRVLGRDAIPGTLRGMMDDFVLFDEVVSYETKAVSAEDTSRPTRLTTQLELRSERVDERKQSFKNLWESAQAVGD
jgi:hypothetical protein